MTASARGKIEIRVYKPKKFHAKAYITHSKLKVVGSAALVGSSNFTRPGLTQNVELNVKFQGPEVAELQDWYEKHWDEATPVNPELLAVLEHNVREFTPVRGLREGPARPDSERRPDRQELGGV